MLLHSEWHQGRVSLFSPKNRFSNVAIGLQVMEEIEPKKALVLESPPVQALRVVGVRCLGWQSRSFAAGFSDPKVVRRVLSFKAKSRLVVLRCFEMVLSKSAFCVFVLILTTQVLCGRTNRSIVSKHDAAQNARDSANTLLRGHAG